MPIKITFVVLNIFILIDNIHSERSNRAIDVEWEPVHPPFDPNIYKEVLDPELCAKQTKYLVMNDTLLMMTCKYCGILFNLSFRLLGRRKSIYST